MLPVFIGWDDREVDAFNACCRSIRHHTKEPVAIIPLHKETLRQQRFYSREGDADKAATAFAYSRFLVPKLSRQMFPTAPYAIFVDCDFIFTRDIAEVLKDAPKIDECSVAVVKHDYVPRQSVKMDGQVQEAYPRKNWSSFILWNVWSPSNDALVYEDTNEMSPAFLHRFQWLQDDEIESLPLTWNWLEGEYDFDDEINGCNPPAAIHFTNGGPWFDDYQNVHFASEYWRHKNSIRLFYPGKVEEKVDSFNGLENILKVVDSPVCDLPIVQGT